MEAMQPQSYRLAPLVSIALAFLAAGLGMWGAWEFGLKQEHGEVNYLALAAPLVALAAALIPPLAESDWRHGHWFKSIIWWAILGPCAAVVLFTSAERVHLAKAGAEAERSAARAAVVRLTADLETAKGEAKDARKDNAKVNLGKGRATRDAKAASTATVANTRVDDLETKLRAAEAKAQAEAQLKAPEWLLPVSLDLIAFIAMWSGLTGLSKGDRTTSPRRSVQPGTLRAPQADPVAKKPREPRKKAAGKSAKKPQKSSEGAASGPLKLNPESSERARAALSRTIPEAPRDSVVNASPAPSRAPKRPRGIIGVTNKQRATTAATQPPRSAH